MYIFTSLFLFLPPYLHFESIEKLIYKDVYIRMEVIEMPGTKSLEKSLEKKYHDILSDCLPVGRRITGELLEYMRTRGWKICIARRIDRNSSIIEELNSISKSKKYVIDDIDRIRKEIVVR